MLGKPEVSISVSTPRSISSIAAEGRKDPGRLQVGVSTLPRDLTLSDNSRTVWVVGFVR